MSFSIGLNLITGIMVGFEHVCDEDDINYLVFDFLFVRIIVEFEKGE